MYNASGITQNTTGDQDNAGLLQRGGLSGYDTNPRRKLRYGGLLQLNESDQCAAISAPKRSTGGATDTGASGEGYGVPGNRIGDLSGGSCRKPKPWWNDNEALCVGLNLRFYRKQKGLSQEQLAELLGCSRSQISSYEESRATPSIRKLFRMVKLIQVSIEDFVSKPLADLAHQKPCPPFPNHLNPDHDEL